jgi:hypothetical protein
MRGVGATCTAPTTHGHLKHMPAPKYGKARRGMKAASSPFRQNGDSSLAATGSLGVSAADRRAWLAACYIMHRHSRSARRRACSAGRVTGRPRYSARREKVGFGGEFGGSRAARAHGTHARLCDRRAEQLARTQRDLAARTTALGTADAAKWVKRRVYCLTQPRATISMGMQTGVLRDTDRGIWQAASDPSP